MLLRLAELSFEDPDTEIRNLALEAFGNVEVSQLNFGQKSFDILFVSINAISDFLAKIQSTFLGIRRLSYSY